MFLVVGETARSQNYALNGYSRGTNDFTKKYNELISFHNVQSCGTSTAISVPCMFSDMKRKEFNSRKAVNSENVLDILYRTGVNLLWIENDGDVKVYVSESLQLILSHQIQIIHYARKTHVMMRLC